MVDENASEEQGGLMAAGINEIAAPEENVKQKAKRSRKQVYAVCDPYTFQRNGVFTELDGAGIGHFTTKAELAKAMQDLPDAEYPIVKLVCFAKKSTPKPKAQIAGLHESRKNGNDSKE